MEFSEAELEKMRPRLRFKVCHRLGFACPDVDDIVQESIRRFLMAAQEGKLRTVESTGAFLNGICQNVILEYARRWSRDTPIPDPAPEMTDKRLAETELFEMRQAIAAGMQQLSARDRQILRAFYLDEIPKNEILKMMDLSDTNFRVVLCRAKDRFREVYTSQVKHRAASSHT